MTEDLEIKMKKGQEELKELSQAQHDKLVKMMETMSMNQEKASDQAKKNMNQVIERVDTIEERIERLENGGAAQGESSFIYQGGS